MASPCFAQRRVMKNLVGLLNDFIGDEHGHLDCLESERIDVSRIDGVGIDDDRLSKIDRFEEGISEAFVVARIGDKISMRVDVKESVDLLAIGVKTSASPRSGPR